LSLGGDFSPLSLGGDHSPENSRKIISGKAKAAFVVMALCAPQSKCFAEFRRLPNLDCFTPRRKERQGKKENNFFASRLRGFA